MLLASQQLVDGIKLGAVAQVLVHLPHLCSYAARQRHTFLQAQCLDYGKCRTYAVKKKKKKKTVGALGIQHPGALTEVSRRLPPQITEGINKICYATQAGINFF